MAALGSQSIASSYEQLLHVDRDQGGDTTTHVSVKDGDNGTTFGFTIATDALMMTGTNRLEFGDTGTYIFQSANGVLDLVSDTEIEINATTIDINGAIDISGDTTTAGNLIINANDKGLTLGADQDATIFSDAAGAIYFTKGTDVTPASDDSEGWMQFIVGDSSKSYLNIYGGEGGGSSLYLYADGGDDDDDKFQIQAGTGGNLTIESRSSGSWVSGITFDGSVGAVTMPVQPAFLVHPAAQQANPGLNEVVVWGTEIFDQGADFASNVFTAPVTGRYQFNVHMLLTGGFDTAHNYLGFNLVTSNRNYQWIVDPDIFDSAGNYYAVNFSMLADMDGADTAQVTHFFNGGTVQHDIDSGSYFSGHLAC